MQIDAIANFANCWFNPFSHVCFMWRCCENLACCWEFLHVFPGFKDIPNDKQLLFQTTRAPFQSMHDFSVCLYCLVMSSKFNFLTVQFALHSVVVSVPVVNRWYFAVNQVKFTCKMLMFQSIFTVSHDVYNILIASCRIVSFRKWELSDNKVL